MPPILAKQPKGVKLFPLESTLGDLSNIQTRGIDLAVLLGQSASNTPSGDQSDEAVKKSRDFIESVRGAFDADGDIAAQGERVEVLRAVLQEIDKGFS